MTKSSNRGWRTVDRNPSSSYVYHGLDVGDYQAAVIAAHDGTCTVYIDRSIGDYAVKIFQGNYPSVPAGMAAAEAEIEKARARNRERNERIVQTMTNIDHLLNLSRGIELRRGIAEILGWRSQKITIKGRYMDAPGDEHDLFILLDPHGQQRGRSYKSEQEVWLDTSLPQWPTSVDQALSLFAPNQDHIELIYDAVHSIWTCKVWRLVSGKEMGCSFDADTLALAICRAWLKMKRIIKEADVDATP